jgi:hypothetical protein
MAQERTSYLLLLRNPSPSARRDAVRQLKELGVIVSAGSIVGAKPIEPYSIVAGNPARRIGSRQTPSTTDERIAVTSS